MARIVDLDHKWATMVGRLLIAFAAMEGLTLQCLKEWLKSPLYQHVMNMRFAQRIDLVIDLSREQDSPNDKIEVFVKNLKAAKELAKKRNAVAHNPLMLCLFEGQEDFVEAISSEKKQGEGIEFEELERLVLRAETLEANLSESKVRLREHEWKPLS